MEKDINLLELRMYFFTIYQLSGIQAGIQCGHSAIEYARKYGNTDEFKNFADNWKTWIVLNGGTTNDRVDNDNISQGTLNQIADSLYDNGINFAEFHEPDLNNALTAVCFIVDERVFNNIDYPNFNEYFESKSNGSDRYWDDVEKEWVRFIGGVKNKFLRELIKDKKLA